MEFLHGRPLSLEDLEHIRREIEAFDDIGAVDDEIRGIVARDGCAGNWPHLLARSKLAHVSQARPAKAGETSYAYERSRLTSASDFVV